MIMDNKDNKEKNPHAGHRERLRKRFLASGLEGFSDHEVLELLLCYAIPRRDVNDMAHELIDRFGSLAGVLDAPANEIMSVAGIGEQAAVLIKLIPQMTRKYQLSGIRGSGKPVLDNVEKAGEFVIPHFQSMTEETAYMLCLDKRCRLICLLTIGGGDEFKAIASARNLVELAVSHKADSVLLAHNHPGGVPVPSVEDVAATRRIGEALRAVGVALTDHLIVVGNEFASMNECGYMD